MICTALRNYTIKRDLSSIYYSTLKFLIFLLPLLKQTFNGSVYSTGATHRAELDKNCGKINKSWQSRACQLCMFLTFQVLLPKNIKALKCLFHSCNYQFFCTSLVGNLIFCSCRPSHMCADTGSEDPPVPEQISWNS